MSLFSKEWQESECSPREIILIKMQTVKTLCKGMYKHLDALNHIYLKLQECHDFEEDKIAKPLAKKQKTQ